MPVRCASSASQFGAAAAFACSTIGDVDIKRSLVIAVSDMHLPADSSKVRRVSGAGAVEIAYISIADSGIRDEGPQNSKRATPASSSPPEFQLSFWGNCAAGRRQRH